MPIKTSAAFAVLVISEPILLAGVALSGLTEHRVSFGLMVLAAGIVAYGVVRLWMRKRGEKVLVLGSSPITRRLLHEIELHPELDWRVTWFPENPRLPAAKEAHRLGRVVHARHPDRIVVGLDDPGHLPVRALLAQRVGGARVEQAATTFEEVTGKVPIESLSTVDLIFGDGFRRSRLDVAWTRGVSVVVAGLGLVAVAPLLALLAIIIKLDSDGPVIFKQERAGLGGKPFVLFKLRTMRTEKAHRSEWERDNLARVTRVGAWLRRLHLDELPQLWNVLRGDMNLVGPRPHPTVNAKMFRKNIPFYELRSLVRPGITGWAQTRHGYANCLDEEIEKMRYDLYYLKRSSAWLDLKLIPDTLRLNPVINHAATAPAPATVNEPELATGDASGLVVVDDLRGEKS